MTPPPQAHAELREKATRLIAAEEAGLDANGEIPREMDDADEAFDEIDPPRTVVALLDRIAALEAQVAEAREHLTTIRETALRLDRCVPERGNNAYTIDQAALILETARRWLTRYPQGAARVK